MTTGSDLPIVGVGVVIVEEGRILLVKRGSEPGKGLWAVPGGKLNRGEHLREAARREVVEETGLEVEIGDVVWVGEVVDDSIHLVLIDFAGEIRGGNAVASDDAEELAWVPLEDPSGYPLTETMYALIDTLRP